ncbi:MAG: hypothetical protein ACJ76B_12915 [Solirubrobacterales bacterium]
MDDSRKLLVLVTALAASLLAPAAATAAAIVPPGNSAVNQYTQTIPTSRGNKEVRQKGDGSPSKTLGHSATKKLQKQGKDGTSTAELAAAGTPAAAVAAGGSGSGGGGANGGGSPAGGGSAAGAGGSGAQASGGLDGSQAVLGADDGKSGVGQVVGEVTGASSSGDLGLWLPLAIIAACAWCAAYFWRHRRTAA